MKHFLGAAAVAGMLLWAGQASAATVSLFCSSSGAEYELCKQGAEAWAKSSGNEVKINKMPAAWDEALPLYQQLLSAQSADADVLLLDVVWIGLLQNHLLDLNAELPKEDIAAHFASTVAAGTVEGKFVALPWYTDTGLMFYRKDLLEKYGKPVPKTWAELTETAKAVQDGERAAGNKDMWGYVWQGKSYEGLTCDAIEWVGSFGGGTIIDEKGNITIDNAKAAEALTLAKGWVNNISPQGVLNYDEESSRGAFEAGNAVFLRNWAYVWGTSQGKDQPLVGKVGVASLPVGAQGAKSSGCMGTAHLGVSKYTKNKEAAVSLIRFMSGLDEQKRRAIAGAYNPTISALYDDAEVLKALPFLKDAQTAFAESVARPSAVTGSSYNRVSQAFYKAVHGVLAGEAEAAEALKTLAADLDKIKQRGKW
ncbi:ABC transporter substrate-binding protein [Taklimakanibacter albus]|uniref:ABC transporter substrate-binding protein n=1 Tax=Taklimakanibacter albus TaxID=2800327 RepID=A0ACC5R2T8_9HYPH|nr:ABC transporter substrate-binding protein [Aestuariivirga sp. YIM B02566]MBK1866928.1 ABC transporter substrate-binding protein [Aestuariivirga sp. YIM B02566]